MDAAREPEPAPPNPCALHADALAVAVCERCGAFLCEACSKAAGARRICPACIDRLDNRPPSREAIAALVLSALGPLGFVPGIVGGVLGSRELRRIGRGEAPSSGEGYARLAKLLGTLYALAAAGTLLWAIGRFVRPDE